MGCTEIFCQICGVSFNIARIRRAGQHPSTPIPAPLPPSHSHTDDTTSDEPLEAAWCHNGRDPDLVAHHLADCDSETCTSVRHTIPLCTSSDGNEDEAEVVEEHLVGEDCLSEAAYSGHRIGWEEMQVSHDAVRRRNRG